MAKDTFYFSHDYNSRSDEKIKRLIRKHGMLGYGVFWAIIEDLYNNANEMQLDCEGIAYEYRIDESVAKSIINDFDLFIINDKTLGSLSVQKRLEERNSKSSKARKSALKRWNKEANAEETQCECIEDECECNAIKERKEKENKEKKKDINIPFDTFWELYDKKRGDKDKIKIKWDALKDSDRELIIDYIPKYIQSQPDKKFRKDPSTFLNNKSWNDELIVEDHSPAKINTKYNLPKNVRAATESEIRHCLGDEYTYNENVEKLGIEYIWLEKVKQCLMIRTDRDKPYFVYNSKIYEL